MDLGAHSTASVTVFSFRPRPLFLLPDASVVGLRRRMFWLSTATLCQMETPNRLTNRWEPTAGRCEVHA